MESFDEAKTLWQASIKREENSSSLNKENLEKIIKTRIRKEKKIVVEYFWASLAYQILIYSFLCHFIVRYWGDMQLMLLSFAGIVLYIPFTIILMRKFKAMFNPPVNMAKDIRANVSNQYSLLSQFFRFKKIFDWIAIPVSCFIITAILIKLYTSDGIKQHVTGSIILFLSWIILFISATWFENKKRFKRPLNQLEAILKDINNNQ